MDLVTYALLLGKYKKIKNLFPEFSETSAYSQGDYVLYQNHIYKFIADKSTGAWDDTKVTRTNVFAIFKSLQQQIDTLPTPIVPQGTIAFSELPEEPVRANIGFMWNISNDFVTDDRFISGAGLSYKAGTNVYVIQDGEDTDNCYYDIFASIDLSLYQLLSNLVTNLNNADDTHYPSAKAVADAIDGVTSQTVEEEYILTDGTTVTLTVLGTVTE